MPVRCIVRAGRVKERSKRTNHPSGQISRAPVRCARIVPGDEITKTEHTHKLATVVGSVGEHKQSLLFYTKFHWLSWCAFFLFILLAYRLFRCSSAFFLVSFLYQTAQPSNQTGQSNETKQQWNFSRLASFFVFEFPQTPDCVANTIFRVFAVRSWTLSPMCKKKIKLADPTKTRSLASERVFPLGGPKESWISYSFLHFSSANKSTTATKNQQQKEEEKTPERWWWYERQIYRVWLMPRHSSLKPNPNGARGKERKVPVDGWVPVGWAHSLSKGRHTHTHTHTHTHINTQAQGRESRKSINQHARPDTQSIMNF